MKKIITFGIVFLISLSIAFATYTCEDICEIEIPNCYDRECSGSDDLDTCLANCDTLYDICIITCDSGECMSDATVWEAECLIYFCTDAEPPLPIRPVWGLDEPPYSNCASDNCYTSYQWMAIDCGAEGLPYLYDSDGDGILDIYEDLDESNSFNNDDSDGDGIPDYADADDDNDGIPTADENPDPNGDGNPDDALDSDGDGIPDYLDTDPVEEPECGVDADCLDGFECIDESCIEIEEEIIGEEEEIDEIEEEEELNIPIPVPVPPCIDTDNGQDYISQGTILSGLDRSDICINSDKLRERYCSSGTTYTAEDVSCSGLYGAGWGCKEGECIELPASQFPWWILILILIWWYYNKNRKKKGKKKKK